MERSDARSDEPDAKLWSWRALRYRGSKWWLDRVLPSSPLGLVVVAFGLPIAWFLVGYTITDDRSAFLATHDVTGQLWFFPLHVICVRLIASLWATRLTPALDGLDLGADEQRRITRGTFGTWASVGALVLCAYFIVRDTTYGLTPGENGLIPFDDPDLWGFAALGRPVHYMMLGLWHVEWLLFGYLLWLQVWMLWAWTRVLRRHDFAPHLATVLGADGYRPAFTLIARTATVSLVFALGNLGFIAFTGELIPREVVHIDGVTDFLREMSDLLSTTMLFVLIIASTAVFVATLRKRLAKAVDATFVAAGDHALEDLEKPLDQTGDAAIDLPRAFDRLHATSGLVRAAIYQRKADAVGGRVLATMVLKAIAPLATTAMKIMKMSAGGGS